jgi:cytochrome c-type biogenesis protein CcmF
MAAGPLLAWKRADLPGILGRLRVALAVAALAALGTWWYRTDGPLLAALGMALAAWLFIGTLVEYAERIRLFRVPLREALARASHLPRAAYGTTIAHAAFAVSIVGITASAAWQSESIQIVRPGETVTLAGYEWRLDATNAINGPNYQAERATISVSRAGRPVTILTPERRFYPVQRTTTVEASIHTTGLADLYAVLGDADGKGGFVMRLYHNPLVPWIWFGAAGMALGGLVSLSDRRLRVGAPRRRTAAVPADAAAA